MITRDGWREIALSTATLGVAGGLAVWATWARHPAWAAAGAPLLVLWGFTIAFFRDPRRVAPSEGGVMVAPADGRVTELSRLEAVEGIDGPAIKVGIFLSIFDVHVNRSPCSGRVVSVEYRPGEFLDARHPQSGVRNECNTIVIEPDERPGPVIVRQIAGLIARRIVCRVRPGDRVTAGQRIGMIKFGSRTELIVPADSGLESAVSLNDHVCGGSTVVMRRRAPAGGTPRPVTGSRTAAAAARAD